MSNCPGGEGGTGPSYVFALFPSVAFGLFFFLSHTLLVLLSPSLRFVGRLPPTGGTGARTAAAVAALTLLYLVMLLCSSTSSTVVIHGNYGPCLGQPTTRGRSLSGKERQARQAQVKQGGVVL